MTFPFPTLLGLTGKWDTAFTSAAFNTNSTGWNGWTFVQRIEAGVLTKSGSKLRLFLTGPTSGVSNLNSIWIGHGVSSPNDYSFDGTQVQVRYGGATSFSFGNTTIQTDDIVYPYSNSNPLTISIDFAGTSNMRRNTTSSANYAAWQRNIALDASNQSKASYSVATDAMYCIASIDVFG